MTELKEDLMNENEETNANRVFLPWKNFQAKESNKSVTN
jgi:hypothetical protein